MRRLLVLFLALFAIQHAPAATILSETLRSANEDEILPLPANWFSAIVAGSGTDIELTRVGARATLASRSELQLYTPLIQAGAYPLEFSFFYSLGFFGQTSALVLELSRNGSAYQDIQQFGTFLEGSYNEEIATGDGFTLIDQGNFRKVFGGVSQQVRISLPTGNAGDSLQFRWRLGSGEGQGFALIRNVVLTDSTVPPPPPPNEVPEPGALVLVAVGLGILAAKKARGLNRLP
jgi:hypothetical protein